jgi:CheY-like chemotaxis protein
MTGKRVLIIDDDPRICEVLQGILEQAGYEAESVDAPPDTVASLLVKQYDILTVDLKMPQMDGTDVAKLARELDSRVPIVVISGFLTPGVREQFLQMGIRHFVAKPFRSKEIVAVLEEALSGVEPPRARE